MGTLIKSSPYIYGIPDDAMRALPVRHDLPDVKAVKLVFRNNEWASAFVRTANGIRKFTLTVKPDCLFLDPQMEQSANLRK